MDHRMLFAGAMEGGVIQHQHVEVVRWILFFDKKEAPSQTSPWAFYSSLYSSLRLLRKNIPFSEDQNIKLF